MADTIAEIAAECGASERAVHGKCRRNHGSKGSIVINESQNAIYQHYLGVGGDLQNLRDGVGLRVTEGFNYF
jgi:hypothetical protein